MRNDFDLKSDEIYLNSGTHSIAPRAVFAAVTRHQREFEHNPTQGLIDAWANLWDVQKAFASFVEARPQDLFFRANVTEVLNQFILGVPLCAGDEILVSDLEYEAIVNVCRYRAKREGLKLRVVSLAEGDLAQQVISALSPETKMVVLSHVTTGTGLVLPIEEIAKVTSMKDVILVVDGAHALGALPLSFHQLRDVDFYGTNLHKWMLGPKGTGVGWVSERRKELLSPLVAGWTTFCSEASFARFAEGDRFAGKMLMMGCHDFAPFFAIKETLLFWQKHSPSKIRSRILELQLFFEEEMKKTLNWELISPQRNARGPLLSFRLPKKVNEELIRQGYHFGVNLYKTHRLQLAFPKVREEWVLRVSPHVYNTEDEILQALMILKVFLRKSIDTDRFC